MDEDGYLAPTNPNTGTIETSMDGRYLTNFGANNYITPITNTDDERMNALRLLLAKHKPESALVFCNTFVQRDK
jgi:hypothetical protein